MSHCAADHIWSQHSIDDKLSRLTGSINHAAGTCSPCSFFRRRAPSSGETQPAGVQSCRGKPPAFHPEKMWLVSLTITLL